MTELELQVPFSGVDPRGKVKFGVLLEMFQEMADVDASQYGLSVRQTLESGITWVLRSYRVDIKRYPDKADKALNIRTWHEPYRNLFSLRTFDFCAGKEYLGRASTWWVLLDIAKMRPLRLDKSGIYNTDAERILEEMPSEVKVPSLQAAQIEQLWRVRWQDLDVNAHTNHAVYFGWALDTVPFEVPETLSPVLVEGEFLHPVPRAEVTVKTEETGSLDGARVFLHSLQTPEGGLEYAKLKSVWK